MIAYLKGTLVEKNADHAVIDVKGVGYQVFLSQTSAAGLPSGETEVSLHIYTHVREDQLTLFGFTTREEKAIFQRLLNVSGVGPKVAITLLSGMKPNDLVQAVIKEDLARLSAIQGIGKKTAERIVVDLKDKFLKEFAGTAAQPAEQRSIYNDAMSALVNLGYPRGLIDKVFTNISSDGLASVQAIVKRALGELKNM